MCDPASLFTTPFLSALRSLIARHHSLYPRIPPQGVFFESLVERAFLQSGWARERVTLTTPNSPQHDMVVGNARLSIKTETGKSVDATKISITKLCTTETGAWDSLSLIRHVMAHLARYDFLFMCRTIWQAAGFHYQLLEVPLDLLRYVSRIVVVPTGKRKGRSSLAADIFDQKAGERLFRAHFDGADGKCQIKNLLVHHCRMIDEWDYVFTE